MTFESDLDRLRWEYSARETRLEQSDLYSLSNKAFLFHIQQLNRHIVDLLSRINMLPLAGRRVLEVGCGSGGILIDWLRFGVNPAELIGVDLLPNRLKKAHNRLPHLLLACADGQELPYGNTSFDIILQFTVLSSILDEEIQQRLAQEMIRVVRPGGAIISYDFWLNPTNPQTVGLRARQIRALFPNCYLRLYRITLAPPLSRRLVPISWMLASLLEKMRFLNTHYLAVIRPY